jgi:tetratricopeptide (TPR) repeat protein
MACTAYFAGRWEEAVGLNERAIDAFESIGDPVRRVDSVFNLAEILCDQGRLDEARPFLEDALRTWRAAGSRFRIGLGTRLEGILLLRAGRQEDALPLLEEARDHFAAVGAQGELLCAEGRIAECLVALGEPARAGTLVEGALARARELRAATVHVPMLRRVLAAALTLEGDLDGARESLERSLRDAREQQSPFEIAQSLDALVKLEPDDELERERDQILAGLGAVAPLAAPPG